MEQSGFFNSVSGDRKYKAEDWAAYFASFIGNGVFPSPTDGLQVVEGSGMAVTVKAGCGWIGGYFYRNTGDLSLTLSTADGVLSRIDRVALHWDLTDRSITAIVKTGTPASTPAAPALQRDADAYELALADITVAGGATSISQAAISDKRLDSTVCGVVSTLFTQFDTTAMAAQLQAALTATYEAYSQQVRTLVAQMDGILEGSAASELLAEINQKADAEHASRHASAGADPVTPAAIGAAVALTATATLSALTGWDGQARTQSVSVTGLLSTDTVIPAPAVASRAAWIEAGVYCSAQAAGSLTFSCETIPTGDLSVNVLIVRG